jgi:hypothetical protein
MTARITSGLLLLSCFAVLVGEAHGQQPATRGNSPARQPIVGQPAVGPIAAQGNQFVPPNLSITTVTPELWVYSQEMRRHDDPAQAVRRKAEARAAQRMQRVAAMKWFGFSNARPQASTTPMMGSYSPAWVGNSPNPYEWVGLDWSSTALIIDNDAYDVR